jgi:hypothetical protein
MLRKYCTELNDVQIFEDIFCDDSKGLNSDVNNIAYDVGQKLQDLTTKQVLSQHQRK